MKYNKCPICGCDSLEDNQRYCEVCGIELFCDISMNDLSIKQKIAKMRYEENPDQAQLDGLVRLVYNDLGEIVEVLIR